MSAKSTSISELREELNRLRSKGVKWEKVKWPPGGWPADAWGVTADGFRVNAQVTTNDKSGEIRLLVDDKNSGASAFEFRSSGGVTHDGQDHYVPDKGTHQAAIRELQTYIEAAEKELRERVKSENQALTESARKDSLSDSTHFSGTTLYRGGATRRADPRQIPGRLNFAGESPLPFAMLSVIISVP